MADYIYTRNIVNALYDINNKANRDGEGNQIFLYQEIKNEPSLPNDFKIICNGSECKIIFNDPLTGDQESTLDNIISIHQSHRIGE